MVSLPKLTNEPFILHRTQAISFIVERFQTACNVCSDMFILRMIQAGIDREKRLQLEIDSGVGSYY
jgi:hypothetical protein